MTLAKICSQVRFIPATSFLSPIIVHGKNHLTISTIAHRNIAEATKHSNKTTGWTEETRDIFHPGDILAVLNRKWLIFSPHGIRGLAELVYHVTGRKRECCQRHIDEDGTVHKVHEVVLPLAKDCESYLRKNYPELAAVHDLLSDEDCKLFSQPKEVQALFLKIIEDNFGKAIRVPPMPQNRADIQK